MWDLQWTWLDKNESRVFRLSAHPRNTVPRGHSRVEAVTGHYAPLGVSAVRSDASELPRMHLETAIGLHSETRPCVRRFENCVARHGCTETVTKGIPPAYSTTYIPRERHAKPLNALQPGSSPKRFLFPFPFSCSVPRIGVASRERTVDRRADATATSRARRDRQL